MLVQTFFVVACLATGSLAQERRAPSMGFMGMRGKKDLDELKRAPSSLGFQGMRGKKDDLSSAALPPSAAAADLEEFKRAPSLLGFQGVRGKKEDGGSLVAVGEKRAPSMGFVGMRGKKDWAEDYYEGAGGWPEEEKRAPSGFFGMRGKKGPSSGFFGMRGKKGPSGFVGMRGKKAPSGFLGVRGKKDDPADDLSGLLQLLRESVAQEEMEEMMGAKRFENYLEEVKNDRVPSEGDLM